MRRIVVAVVLLIAAQFANTAALAGTAMAQRIDRDVQTVLRRTGTPAATVLVLSEGRPVYARAYGLRNVEKKQPAGIGTHYEIGSITKQFTAAAILQLQDAGKLSIDAKVSAYLPEAPHAGEITLRQLLTHTSGLPDFLDAGSEERMTEPATFAQIMALVAGKPLDFPPGSRASYSNTGYIMLGRIIELVSHDSYQHYVRTHLLDPAGMHDTFTVADEPSLPDMASGYRHRAGKRERAPTIHDSVGWSAGHLVSTVGDLQKWNVALASGKIVPAADYALMTTAQKTSDGEDSGYGLGLFIDTLDGQPRIGHTGGSFGFTAANFYFPTQHLRIIVLSNDADAPEPGETMANAIFGAVFPEYERAAMLPAAGEDAAITSKVRTGFSRLQAGKPDASLFSASLNAKLANGLAQRMAEHYAAYAAPTAVVFKGRRVDGTRHWVDYLLAFGPGSTLKFSVALDTQGKITSLGFDTF